MVLDLYAILVGFGLACCARAPLYLYFNLIMAMAELDSGEKRKTIEILSHPQSGDESDINMALNIDIKSLKTSRKVLEQEPCDDAVSRQSVLEELRTCFDTHTIYDENNGENYIIYEDAVDMMEKLPSTYTQEREIKNEKYRYLYN